MTESDPTYHETAAAVLVDGALVLDYAGVAYERYCANSGIALSRINDH